CGRIYHDADLCSSDDCPGNDIAMPELLNHWTVDEVAECLDGVGQELYRKLWSYIEATTDGEAPLAKVAWGDLTREHKVELVHAIQQEFPDDDI
ncbi:hypothetical protein, partial [Klebsiella pneumoniae]